MKARNSEELRKRWQLDANEELVYDEATQKHIEAIMGEHSTFGTHLARDDAKGYVLPDAVAQVRLLKSRYIQATRRCYTAPKESTTGGRKLNPKQRLEKSFSNKIHHHAEEFFADLRMMNPMFTDAG